MTFPVPTVPVSCGAMLFDADGRLLILKPTYKSGWTLPSGIMEARESPWEGCRREVLEETGLTVTEGRLAAIDTRPPKPRTTLGVRFLFDCGTLTAEQVDGIVLQASEISRHQFLPVPEALELLRPAIRRRVAEAIAADGRCVYLEDGRRVDGVG